MLAIFLFAIAAASASDVNDTAIASEDTNQMDLSSNNEITEDEVKLAEAEIQKITDKFVEEIDKIVAAKEKEVMQV